MGKSCSIDCHVRNKEGKVVKSKLFSSLLSHLPSRKQANTYYGIGTSEKFLSQKKVQREAKFDENGEITFKSLSKLANINVPQEKILHNLNKEIKAGSYTYEEALNKLQEFNKNHEYKDEYLATLSLSDKSDNVQLSIVPRTGIEEKKLNDIIKKLTLKDRLVKLLKSRGVSVDFIQFNGRERGRYSTENIQQAVDGLYHLIQVSHGEHVTETLAEEAGHFAVAALGDAVLVKRLEKLLTPEAIKTIYEELGKQDTLSAREAMGALVGRALMESVEPKSPIKKLAHRIANMAKRVFYNIKGDTLKAALLDAETYASKIAEGFMSSEFQGTVEEAIKIRETLYDKVSFDNIEQYKKTIRSLSLMIDELKSAQLDVLSKKLIKIKNTVESGRTEVIARNINSSIADELALDGIAVALDYIKDLLQPGAEIQTLLDKMDNIKEDSNFIYNMKEYGAALRQLRSFQKNCTSIMNEISKALSNNRFIGDESRTLVDHSGVSYVVPLKNTLESMRDTMYKITDKISSSEKNLFIKFCESFLGANSVTLQARVVWGRRYKRDSNGKIIVKDGKPVKTGIQLTRREDERTLTVEQMVEALDTDIGLTGRFIRSMSNNPDIIGQIVDIAAKHANNAADNHTLATWNELKSLEEEWNKNLKSKFGRNQSILFERDNEGNFTGNLISELNWGLWEADLKAEKDRIKEDLLSRHPNWYTYTSFERGKLLEEAYRTELHAWHASHSKFNSEGVRVPNYTYANYDFKPLMDANPELKDFYDKYLELKKKLDENLPEGSTNPIRLPQFKGTFANRVAANKDKMGMLAAVKGSIRTQLNEEFLRTSEDVDMGSDLTYNTVGDEEFGLVLTDAERCDRLPLYGINKLENMNELSTNLFNTTLSYASMAYTFSSMSQIVDSLEVGKEVLYDRRVGSLTEKERVEDKHKNPSLAFNRYVKFIDQQIYNNYYTKKEFLGMSITKLMQALSSLGTKLFLYGNTFGGVVNTGTGFLELLKEAVANEYFDLKDFAWANKTYMVNLKGGGAWGYGLVGSPDKASAFMRYFNVKGDNKREFREWRKHRRARNMFDKLWMLPYSMGDHYMQAMGYLALAHKTKLYTIDGTSSTLYDAYEVDGVSMKLKGVFYKTEEDAKDAKHVRALIDSISSAPRAFGGSPIITLSAEDTDLLNKYNIDPSSGLLQVELSSLEKKLEYSIADETKFMSKAREIGNRLHGVYNKQDYAAFQATLYGKAVLSMRGWAVGQFERIFSENIYSVALGRNVEGNLNTAMKTLFDNILDHGIQGFGAEALILLCPMSKKCRQLLESHGFSVNQQANSMRTWADNLILSIFIVLINCLAKSKSGEDDDDDLVAGRLYYFAYRLYLEQSALRIIPRIATEKNQLLDLTPAGFSAGYDIGTFWYEVFGSLIADESDSEFFYQSNSVRHAKYEAKWKQHLERATPFVKDIFKWMHPYEAVEAYKYGLKTKR